MVCPLWFDGAAYQFKYDISIIFIVNKSPVLLGIHTFFFPLKEIKPLWNKYCYDCIVFVKFYSNIISPRLLIFQLFFFPAWTNVLICHHQSWSVLLCLSLTPSSGLPAAALSYSFHLINLTNFSCVCFWQFSFTVLKFKWLLSVWNYELPTHAYM